MAVRRPGLERPPQLQLKTRYGNEYTCGGGSAAFGGGGSAALAAAAPLLWRRQRVGQQLGQVQQLQSAFDLGIQMSAFGLVPIGALSGRPRYKAALGCCVFFSGESLKELHEAEDEILRLWPPFLKTSCYRFVSSPATCKWCRKFASRQQHLQKGKRPQRQRLRQG